MSSYFFDRNVPVKLVRIVDLFDLESTVTYLDDQFDQNTEDVVWMSALRDGVESPIVICGDMKITRNPAELQVLKSTDLTFVFLKPGWTNIPWNQHVPKFLKAWTDIAEQTTRARIPTIFELSIQGKISRKCHTRDL